MTIANITKSEEGQDSEALINERTYLVPKIEKGLVQTAPRGKSGIGRRGSLFVSPNFSYEFHPELHSRSAPSQVPFRRRERQRHPLLRATNDFRHWWKTSRLLVRLAGSLMYLRDPVIWSAVLIAKVSKRKERKVCFKIYKKIGQGGPQMHAFLRDCHPFTRTLRIIVGVWRTLEALSARRVEVGVEEAMAFIGNRVFRYASRYMCDFSMGSIVLPMSKKFLFDATPFIVAIGLIRAILPFAMSFQGSWFGRFLTRNFFNSYYQRWRPVSSIEMTSFQAVEGINENPKLYGMAHAVATALAAPDRIAALQALDFHQIGSGSGGYSLFKLASQKALLHVAPYGPSMLGQMPDYIVLETTIPDPYDQQIVKASGIYAEGFCYSGAFFRPPHFAALKFKYEAEYMAYFNACKRMGPISGHSNPPTDLACLKIFLSTGQEPKEKRKQASRFQTLDKDCLKLARKLLQLRKANVAPRRVILYLEGLDCAGKSSSAKFIRDALCIAGYSVETHQHNRPPTPEQLLRPLMERFAIPSDDKSTNGGYHALVWDRGPAGDFIFGYLAHATPQERQDRYEEFLKFDLFCRNNDILFCKMMFITDRDSIASTLGKRIAQKRIAQDLRSWISSSMSNKTPELGLDEIEMHIDPSDFVAFNKYHKNLELFLDVANHTNHMPRQMLLADETGCINEWDNPWLVVNTSARYPARRSLIKVFEKQLDTFCAKSSSQQSARGDIFMKQLFNFGIGKEKERDDDDKNDDDQQIVVKDFGPTDIRTSTITVDKEEGAFKLTLKAALRTFYWFIWLIALSYLYVSETYFEED